VSLSGSGNSTAPSTVLKLRAVFGLVMRQAKDIPCVYGQVHEFLHTLNMPRHNANSNGEIRLSIIKTNFDEFMNAFVEM
jgi:hypothetical protein